VLERGLLNACFKENPEEEWSYFYGAIQGFDYEEGYEYVIEVLKCVFRILTFRK
jgi:hypothetical protein